MFHSLTEPNKAFALIASALLLFVGVFRIPVEPMPLLFQLMFETAVVMALVTAIIIKGDVFFALFLALAYYSQFVAYGKGTYFAFQSLFYACLWYFVIVSMLKAKHINYFLNIICVIAIASMIWMVLQLNNLDPLYKPMSPGVWDGNQVPTGLMLSRFSVAGIFAFCFPAFLRGYWHLWLIPLVVLVYFTDCMTGYIAIVVGIYAYMFLMAHKYLMVSRSRVFNIVYPMVGLFAFVTFIITKGYGSFITRWEVWSQAYYLFKQKWILSAGLGHWAIVADNPFGNKFIHSLEGKWWVMHNEFFQAVFEMGILFVIITIGFYMHKIIKYKSDAMISYVALVSMTVFSMAFFPFHNPINAMIGVTWLAILTVQLKYKKMIRIPY